MLRLDKTGLVRDYENYLVEEERSRNTITKYMRDLKSYFIFLQGEAVTKESLVCWKEKLTQTYLPASVNSMLAAVNGFLEWAGYPQYRVKPLKIQREIFTKPEKELSKEEYIRLVKAAEEKQNCRLALILQTICATGIRVSELQFITLETARTGRTVVDCKGKKRTVFLPGALSRALQEYCREHGIKEGVVFRTKNRKPLDRSNIWRDMKNLCCSAGVEPEKVFPHNLRHLFARTYYHMEKDLSRLADLLGHSNVTTTRIYTMESGLEHAKQVERMGLVVLRI
ncbi:MULTISPECIES: tyrosine-type recombinase/integrase [Blautia]|nr:tyrosine-type recombinase/integrase [Blautia sp. RD014232]MBC5672982.1 tyrosine-type recombinase/integrase [Blautia celeris]MBS5267156.1 tyrosine-type recombinase/integrase [Clostridiales bacterium]POP36782.1 integrase [Blautia producta]RHP81036.1 integrase [Blautia sp. OF01-4LB]RHS11258.1 integrase [Blautia sp. AF13-16]